ncbi:glycosyltransferase family 2 protein [Leifsonia sp. NPDC058194]|uniref:glycosyltransferase family 2 protein n=1 Tax=Leifsonia sp. NPDC058194 TaxID=3346374 RepID=UPI0036DB615B
MDIRTVSGAVIVPAHDEESVIARTLEKLRPVAASGTVDVLVVCNGCSDATADVARRYPGVTVIEIETASKVAAMNVGDRATARWPRLYLDADIQIEPEAVAAVLHELAREGGALAARPASVEDVHDATFPVRAYYRARARIPETGVRLWGAGGYAVSEAGHARFERFPDIVNDDSWIHNLFTDDEKAVLDTPPMLVRVPRTTKALLAVITRHRRGQLDLGVSLGEQSSQRARAILHSAKGPRSAVDAFCYAALTQISRMRSRRADAAQWSRDPSTREPAPTR